MVISALRIWLHGRHADGRRWYNWRLVCLLLLALIPFPIWLATTGHANLPPVSLPANPAQLVSVARVGREDLYNAITLSAEFRPYTQVELHAKVSGYLEMMNVDIGDCVKAGQLLAKLEVPELRDELRQGLAAQKRAEAEYRNAHLVYTRLLAVEKEHPNLVAQQELDTAEAKDLIAEAVIATAKATVERYQTMLDYTRISAPFDGVITRRFADPGALIQAGTTSATQSLPLLCVSDNYRLRLDFPVSVSYVKDIQLGAPVDVQVQSLGGRSFKGTISRTTQTVEEATRTMMTEIEVPNPNLELVPGMYATVVINVERRPNALAIPTEAISSGQKSSVYLVSSNAEIEERPVTLGLETSTKYEVTAGLKEGDLVFVGSRSQVKLGQKVEAKLIGPLAQQ
jgi:RND family efflux transporter MFP subunit